jgi:hypothetical protein
MTNLHPTPSARPIVIWTSQRKSGLPSTANGAAMITVIIILSIVGFLGYRYMNGSHTTSPVAGPISSAQKQSPDYDLSENTTSPTAATPQNGGKLALAICAAPIIIALQVVLTMFGFALKSHFLCNRAADLGDLRRSLFR